MLMDQDQYIAWREHIDQYARCPNCGENGEHERTYDVVDPQTPGESVKLRERMDCPACGCRWWEVWVYHGREVTEH